MYYGINFFIFRIVFLLVILSVSLAACGFIETKRTLGNVSLPAPNGTTFTFDYTTRWDNAMFEIYIERVSNTKQLVVRGVWERCKKEAQKITKPVQLTDGSKEAQKKANDSHYDETGNLTRLGKAVLRETRKAASRYCRVLYKYGEFTVKIYDKEGNIYFDSQYRLKARGRYATPSVGGILLRSRIRKIKKGTPLKIMITSHAETSELENSEKYREPSEYKLTIKEYYGNNKYQ